MIVSQIFVLIRGNVTEIIICGIQFISALQNGWHFDIKSMLILLFKEHDCRDDDTLSEYKIVWPRSGNHGRGFKLWLICGL
jgi:hypothetical protein